jgi:hypothetical protein
MNYFKIIVGLLFLLIITACGSHIYLVKDLSADYPEKGWKFEIEKIEDGIHSYECKFLSTQSTFFSPDPSTNRFILMYITISNLKDSDAVFDFSNLKIGDSLSNKFSPTMVAQETFIGNKPANVKPELSGNEQISRTVIFSVPPEFQAKKLFFDAIDKEISINENK